MSWRVIRINQQLPLWQIMDIFFTPAAWATASHLAMNKKNRRAHLESLRGEERTMIFHEAPHKLRTTLEDLCAAFGPERRIALCRTGQPNTKRGFAAPRRLRRAAIRACPSDCGPDCG